MKGTISFLGLCVINEIWESFLDQIFYLLLVFLVNTLKKFVDL